jgi:polyphosphate kinase
MTDPGTKARLSFSGSIFDDPALFIDRDFSLIEFQRRVFEEARDETNPLLERLRFLSIVVSNFDEFEMVRMPQLAESGSDEDSESPRTDALAHFEHLRHEIVQCMREVRQYLRESIVPALACERIHLLEYSDLQSRGAR